MGWVQRKRNLGGLVFVDLRDRTGLLQLVFGEEINKEAFEKADLVKSEYCIAVTGEVIKRESPNNNLPTGMVELKGESIKILSESETPPIYIKENLDAGENIRLKYRYLDLRRPDMQKILMIRHRASKVVRDYLDENGFLEMETPMKTIRRYNLKNIEDLYQGVGVGEINPTNMITKLKDAYDKENSKLLKITDVNIIKEEKPRKQTNNNYSGITVKDMSNIQVRFAKCCSPVYGDKITGYITRGKGVSIHRSDCKNIITLEENESHKIVEVSWGNGNKENYTADIEIKAEDRLGLLTDVIEVLSGLKANILYISAVTNKQNIAVVSLKVNISGIDHLKDIQAKLKKIKDVKDVYRKKN